MPPRSRINRKVLRSTRDDSALGAGKRAGTQMSIKTFALVAGMMFSVVALAHVVRAALGWQASIAGWAVPMWVSWLGAVVTGYLGYQGLRLSRRA